MSEEIDIIKGIIETYPNKKTKYESLTIGISSKNIMRVHDGNKSYILIDFSKCNNLSDELFTYQNKDINKTQINYFIDNCNLLTKNISYIPLILDYDLNKKLILMDDVGNKTLKTLFMVDKNLELSYNCFFKLIDIINTIQQINISKHKYFKERQYGKESISGEMKKFVDVVIIKGNKERVEKNDLDNIYKEIDKLATEINYLPKTIIHRDYQSTNIIFSNNQPYIIDFQDMCIGHFIYDIISLVYDLNIYLNEKMREKYINYFWIINETAKRLPFNDFLQIVYKYSQHRILQSITWRSRNYLSEDFKIYKEVRTGLKYINDIINKSDNSNLFRSIYPYLPTGIATVILGAGKGLRMKSKLPKVLCSLKDKPMIEYVVDTAKEIGSDFIYIVVGYKKEFVKEKLKDKGVKFIVQEEQLGTGNALAHTSSTLSQFTGDVISMMGNAPLIPTKAIIELIDYHRSNNFVATILTKETNKPFGCGRVIRNKDGSLKTTIEEADINSDNIRNIKEVTVGVIIFKAKPLYEVLPNINNSNKQNEYYIWDILRIYLEKGEKVGINMSKNIPYIHSANTTWQLQQLAKLMDK